METCHRCKERWLKRHHPDYRDITISQSNLLALPIDGDVSDQVLNIEESEAKSRGRKEMAGLVGKRMNVVLMVISLGRLKKPWSLTSSFARPKQSFWKRLSRGGNFLPLKRLRLGKLPSMRWAENTAYSLCVSLLCFRTGLQIGIKAGCALSPWLIGGSTS
jgi:hypothetical protein